MFSTLPVLTLAMALLGGPQAAKPGAKPAAKAKAPASPVLAIIGKTKLTQEDMDSFLATLSPQQRMQLQFSPGGMDEIVRRLAERKLMAEKARRMGLERDANFLRRLATSKDELLAISFLDTRREALTKLGNVTDEEAKAYFEAHKDKFSTPATYDARHILVAKKPEGAEKERSEEEVAARVKEVQAALASGKAMADLVEQYSDDAGSKASKGLYTAVQKGQFVPEFEKAAMTQGLGKVGEPVATRFGTHIIVAEKRTEPSLKPFEEVKDQVKQQAQQEKGMKVWGDLMKELSAEIPFKIMPKSAPAPAPAAHPEAGQ